LTKVLAGGGVGRIRDGNSTLGIFAAIASVWTLLATSPAIAQNDPRVVRTKNGFVSGTGGDVRVFRGIPYALAPTGDLRWHAPQPALKWKDVRDGSAFAPDCIQPPYYPELRRDGQSEDCLTLNVWTPAKKANEPLPVMVGIYGGGFINGSGSHPSYDGTPFAIRGVVLVTLNYRMELFGFMAHPALTAESPNKASGNYGLMDQVAALQWVKRNIAAFGGDPNRVTVFGQSAGAMSIESLMTSPMARGLFQQAILQSVGAMRPMSNLSEAESFGLQVGEKIDDLRAMTSGALVQRLKELSKPERDVTTKRQMDTIVDGYVIPSADYTSFPKSPSGDFRPDYIVF
jgi:para-nitrobenzyl esterase